MSLVTLTDHDTIAGALTLIDRPDFFISEEVTAIFPENGCVMHVLTWNINQAQHDEIQAARGNIYQLCDYLNRENIAHGLAHPLLCPNWQLDAELFEKSILLFPTFEGINGLVDRRLEPDLFTILDRLTPETIAALSRKHGIAAVGAAPARKALTAGSDDHVHRRCGSVYSEIAGQHAPASFLTSCMAGDAQLVGEQAHLNTMAVCIKHTDLPSPQGAGRGARGLPQPVRRDDGPHRRARPLRRPGKTGEPRRGLRGQPVRRSPQRGDRGRQAVRHPGGPRATDRGRRRTHHRVHRAALEQGDRASDRWIARRRERLRSLPPVRLLSRSGRRAGHGGAGLLRRAPLREAGEAGAPPVGELGPRSISRDAPTGWRCSATRVEHVDGVSTWCSRFVDRARAEQQEVLVPHCGQPLHNLGAGALRHRLPAITSFSFPFYDQLRFYVPSLIDTLIWAWSEKITHVELATPGPMGLVGLMMAKVLQLPVTASYHTEVPALINLLGGIAFSRARGAQLSRLVLWPGRPRVLLLVDVARDVAGTAPSPGADSPRSADGRPGRVLPLPPLQRRLRSAERRRGRPAGDPERREALQGEEPAAHHRAPSRSCSGARTRRCW